MKKLLLILPNLLLSCEDKCNIKRQPTDITYGFEQKHKITTYTIDSCEYIGQLTGSNTDVLTHKGNCNNPQHKR